MQESIYIYLIVFTITKKQQPNTNNEVPVYDFNNFWMCLYVGSHYTVDI